MSKFKILGVYMYKLSDFFAAYKNHKNRILIFVFGAFSLVSMSALAKLPDNTEFSINGIAFKKVSNHIIKV